MLDCKFILPLQEINLLPAGKRCGQKPKGIAFGVWLYRADPIEAREGDPFRHGRFLDLDQEFKVWLALQDAEGVDYGLFRSQELGLAVKHVGGEAEGVCECGVIHRTYSMTTFSQKARTIFDPPYDCSVN
jgi:hypothetical protein